MEPSPGASQVRRTPLQTLWHSVECVSLANGKLVVTPKWRGEKPGLFTRMLGATRLERALNRELRKVK